MRIQSPERLEIRAFLAGDKSLSHRALIFAALADSGSSPCNLSLGQDVESTAKCLRALGVTIDKIDESWEIEGSIRAGFAKLDCGNSGTTARLLIGLVAGMEGVEAEFSGDASLSKRPMARVVDPLRLMGADIEYLGGDGCLPLLVKGRKLKGIHYESPIASAQVKSAILLAGLHADGETSVAEPFPSRDHTEIMLAHFGPMPFLGFEFYVPGDVSSASALITAALLHPQGSAKLPQVCTNPTRTGFLVAAERMGASLSFKEHYKALGEANADIEAQTSKLRAITLAAKDVPAAIDEIHLLALLATQAEGQSRFEGLAELRVKESDRLAETARILSAFGASVEIEGDGLIINGPTPLQATKIDAGDDHRMVMLATLCALIAKGESEVLGAEAVAISYPSFFHDLGINL